MRVTLVVAFVAAIALCVGIVAGMQLDDDPTGGATPTSDCPIVQVPVSDHVEATCIPEAAPLLDMFDERAPMIGSHADGYVEIGTLWLAYGTGWGICWLNATDEVRCSSTPG